MKCERRALLHTSCMLLGGKEKTASLTLLACFFLSSFSFLIKNMYIHVHVYAFIVHSLCISVQATLVRVSLTWSISALEDQTW